MKDKWVIGNQQNWLYGVTKDKRCLVVSSMQREGVSWLLLQDEKGKFFESPEHLWNKE